MKILLIEDDDLMIRMYQRVLTFKGYTVEIAENGLLGYEKAKTFKPNLILLDIMMPVLNGLQTLEKLKQDPATKDIKVIILSNLVHKRDSEYAVKLGAIKYLIKSDYDPNEVIEEINKCLIDVAEVVV